MAALELDPVFLKALGFLRSRSKESTEQLKGLLNEALAGSGRGRFSKLDRDDSKKSSPAGRRRDDKAPTPCIKLAATEGSRKEAERRAEKRAGERIKTETTEKLDSSQAKKLRLEKPRKAVILDEEEDDDDTGHETAGDESVSTEEGSKEDGGSKDDTGDSNQGDSNHGDSNHNDSNQGDSNHGDSNHDDSIQGDSNQGSTDADDFAMELGLACVVCKQLDVSAGNQLIECQECHSLYHQLCHKPQANETDPSDPRFVWYCSRCTRNMKKQVTKKVKTPTASSNLPKIIFQKASEAKEDGDHVLNIFKRVEAKTSSSTPSGSSAGKTPYTGLASFAANLTSRSSSAPTSSSLSSSKTTAAKPIVPAKTAKPAKPVPKTGHHANIKAQAAPKMHTGTAGKKNPQTSTDSAMKRLQLMKKKASKR